jgi:AcrR family transcriptional regulator
VPDSSRLPAGSRARQARAELILDAAAGLLLQHGYKRVTIDDVAAQAGVGKGTIYLHWKTREALFWAVLAREALRLLEQLTARLPTDEALALPSRLMPELFREVARRPLVRALLLNDAELLGNLAKDETVRAAQRQLAGNENYLVLLAAHGVLRPGLTPETGGHILGSVMSGFFQAADSAESGLPLEEQADLLADVLHRTLETDGAVPSQEVAALSARVIEMLTGIAAAARTQLRHAYG